MKRFMLTVLLGVCLACGGDDDEELDAGLDAGDDVGADSGDSGAGAIAHFEPSADGALAFDDLPFPSDLFLDSDGNVDIAAVPSTRPVWSTAPDLFRSRRGFCSSCAIFFPIDGELDPGTVPGDATDASASIEDPLFLVDVTDGTLGEAIPLLVEYGRGRVVVRPVRGVVLTAGRRYAAGLRTSLLATDGSALQASPTFERARAGDDTDPAAARALAVMDATLDLLDRDTLAVATVFRVDDGFDDLQQVATLETEASAPVTTASGQLWGTPTDLDEIFGVQSEDNLAADVAPAEGEEGVRAIAHGSIELVVGGSFEAPLVMEGDASVPAIPLRDDSGAVTTAETTTIPFLLSVPSGADVTNLPVIVFHPGLGDHMQWGLLAAELAARPGAALITFEPVFRGTRGPTASDESHWLREDDETTLGADGLFEHVGTDVIARERGLVDVPDGMLGFPGYRYGTLLQNVADLLAVTRLLKEGDWSAVAAEDARLDGLAFDAESIHLLGGFYGAAVGVGAMAVDDSYASSYLVAVPGAWIEVDTEPPVSRAALPVVRAQLGVFGGFDDVTRRHSFDPLLELYRWAIEPTDPTVLARRLYTDTELVDRPHMLVHLARLDEWVGAPTSESFLVAAGIPGFGNFEFADVTVPSDALEANLGGRTVGAVQYEAGHFGVLVRTDTATVEPPIVPPFTAIDPERNFDQPTEAMLAELQAFYTAAIAGTTPRIEAPD